MSKKKHKQSKVIIKEKSYRFWNCGIEYICNINAPVSIPDYRLKEVFDNTFVGKKESRLSVLQNYITFKRLDQNITYEVKPVKEITNVK